MRRVALSVPTASLVHLGLFPARFFEHNESLDVMQAFRLAGEDITLLVRITRRVQGPSREEVLSRTAELREKYGLQHFELLEVDRELRAYTALLRVSITEGMGEVFGLLGADVLPTRPFTFREQETLATFFTTDAQLRSLRELMDRLSLKYKVERSRRAVGTDLLPAGNLTDRQRHLLQLAHRLGYFQSPAKTDLAHLAQIAGVSKAAVSKQLRVAERKVLDELFGSGGRGEISLQTSAGRIDK